MDKRLLSLISDYQLAVPQAVELMAAAGIERPTSDSAWAGLDIPQQGKLQGSASYWKYGYGCAVRSSGIAVDFDFGENGEIDGFDAWRVIGFAGPRLGAYGFSSGNELKTLFDAAAQSRDLTFSGYLI